jgi:6-pyruvoyltetrahydropterin/6-carboxytetrahydropterin synthase
MRQAEQPEREMSMQSSRAVRVERNRLRFAAAHMATFAGECEPLHGHNYDVFVEVEGDLTDESWVIDFGVIKGLARQLCERLDHRFLLQAESRQLSSQQHDGVWYIRFGEDRLYQFPAQDVLALPIDNSTAERLAEWIHRELSSALRQRGLHNIRRLSVGVEEMPGQAGWFTAGLDG